MPISFDLDKVRSDYKCNIYFETGLWDVLKSETSLCQAMKLPFEKCCSVEINDKFIEIASHKFNKEIEKDKLKLFQGDSKNLKQYLEDLSPSDDSRILFFLDSHGGPSRCPLVEELDAIKQLNRKDHIIMIDDIRIIRSCVWGDSRYNGSNFENLLKEKISSINPLYQFSYLKGVIENDVLIAFI